jgi:hypothetical protein
MGGLSFLNTGLLFFAAAAVLPLLIWLLAKKKPKRVVFSSLRFIKASQQQEKKRTKLKNIILLIIRMLIILLVALAVARPLFMSPHLKPGKKHPPTAIAILLDTSASMDYVYEAKSDLDRARDIIKIINKLCTPQDRLIVVTSDDKWNRLHAQLYAEAFPADLLDRIGITYDPLSVTDMLALATEKLQESQLANRELYYLTDTQQQEYSPSGGERMNVINVASHGQWENLSCFEARPLPQLVEKSRRQSLEFKLTNHGKADRSDVLVRVVLGGVKVAEKFVTVPARQTLNQSISVELPSDGWQSGYVEVVDDRLASDNRSYFAFPFRKDPRIAVITSRSALPPYLNTLLSVYAGPQGGIDLLRPAQINLASLKEYQNFVFYAPGQLSPKLREFVQELQGRGMGALFCLDRDLAPDYKAFISTLFNSPLGAWQTAGKNVSYLNQHHYVTSLASGKNLANPLMADYWSTAGGGGSILAGNGREAYMLTRDKLLLLTFDLGSPRSTFFLDASFPVIAYRALEYSGTAIAAPEGMALGETVSASSVVLPDGSRLDLATRSLRLEEPGIYELIQADGSASRIAVNPDREESEFKPMDYKPFKYIRVLGDDWGKALFHTRLGHDLWKYLLAAALLLFLLEIILVKLEELRPAQGSPREER